MNKVWQKPKLIILYRGRPEESVLATCKSGPWGTGGAIFDYDGQCYKNKCALCNSIFQT